MDSKRFIFLKNIGLNKNSETIVESENLIILKTMDSRIAISVKEWKEFSELLDKKQKVD